MQKITLYTDGGARGNPGPAGIGVVLLDNGHIIKEFGKYIGEATNNQAEYMALILGLKAANELGAERVDIFMDSELIVKQIKGEYKIKNSELAKLFLDVKNLLLLFRNYSISHIERAKNSRADMLVNKAIDAIL